MELYRVTSNSEFPNIGDKFFKSEDEAKEFKKLWNSIAEEEDPDCIEIDRVGIEHIRITTVKEAITDCKKIYFLEEE